MKFTIILPVHNGIKYIEKCVKSILAQSYKGFNLIVLENSSNDGTLEWLQSIEDNRLSIIPSKKFLSMEENWQRILTIPKNEFFTLTGYDDIFDLNYLDTINDLIEKHPKASLYKTHFRYIDNNGEILRSCLPMNKFQYSHELIALLFNFTQDTMGTGFMMRSSDFDSVGGFSSYPKMMFADHELLFKLTELNYSVTAIEECFSYREHDSISVLVSAKDYQDAFLKYLTFLKKQSLLSIKVALVFERHSSKYIKTICKGLIIREITRYKKDNKNSVNKLVNNFKKIHEELIPKNNWSEDFLLRFYILIDRLFFGRFFLKQTYRIKFKLKKTISRIG